MGAVLSPVPRPDLLDLVHLPCGSPVAEVAERCANTNGAIGQALVDDFQDFVTLVERGLGFGPAVVFRPTNEATGRVVHLLAFVDNLGPGTFMARGRAVIGLGLAVPLGVPLVHPAAHGAELQVEGGRHAVTQGDFVAHRPLPVVMRVDETGRDDMAVRVDGFLAADRLFGNDSDSAVPDADVGNGVVRRFRVHDPTTQDHEVVIIGHGSRRQAEAGRQYNKAFFDGHVHSSQFFRCR